MMQLRCTKQLDVVMTSAATPPPLFRSVLRLYASVDARLSVDACACGCNDFCWPVQLKMIEMNARRITLSFRPTMAHTCNITHAQHFGARLKRSENKRRAHFLKNAFHVRTLLYSAPRADNDAQCTLWNVDGVHRHA